MTATKTGCKWVLFWYRVVLYKGPLNGLFRQLIKSYSCQKQVVLSLRVCVVETGDPGSVSAAAAASSGGGRTAWGVVTRGCWYHRPARRSAADQSDWPAVTGSQTTAALHHSGCTTCKFCWVDTVCSLSVSTESSMLFSAGLLACSRHHLSYDDCPEDKKENYQNCYLLCCVWQL